MSDDTGNHLFISCNKKEELHHYKKGMQIVQINRFTYNIAPSPGKKFAEIPKALEQIEYDQWNNPMRAEILECFKALYLNGLIQFEVDETE